MADQLFKKNKLAVQRTTARIQKERSQTWLFVCEGTKTEPNYLASLINYANSKSQQAKIKADIHGVGRNTESLVECVEDFFRYVGEFKSYPAIPHEKIFVLFDKDSFKAAQFGNAINMSISKGYIPIWSNECFELWYILHFCYYTSDNGREKYFDKLDGLLGIEYDKADDIFSLINSSEHLKNAITYSKKLEENSKCETSPSKKVPCTQMLTLIKEIEKRLKIDLSV